MRVLTVSHVLDSVGGRPLGELRVARGLADRGHSVDLLFEQDGDLAPPWGDVARRRVRVPALHPERLGLRPLVPFARSVLSGAALRTDVVYVHRDGDTLLGGIIARVWRVPLVFHAHGVPPKVIGRQLAAGLGAMTRMISVSHDTAERWMDVGVLPDRVDVVHNGVDLDAFRPGGRDDTVRTRTDLGIGPDDFVVLYVGRLDEEKGPDVLLEAFSQLRACVPAAALLLVGDAYLPAGGYEEVLRPWRQAPGVHWLGRRSDTAALYRAADVTVVPSRWPDPFPNVVIEAMASGCPVVASSIGGIPEALANFPDALVPPDDTRALLSALERLATAPGRRTGRSAAYRRLAEEQFSVEGMVSGVEASLARALTSERRPHRGRFSRER